MDRLKKPNSPLFGTFVPEDRLFFGIVGAGAQASTWLPGVWRRDPKSRLWKKEADPHSPGEATLVLPDYFFAEQGVIVEFALLQEAGKLRIGYWIRYVER